MYLPTIKRKFSVKIYFQETLESFQYLTYWNVQESIKALLSHYTVLRKNLELRTPIILRESQRNFSAHFFLPVKLQVLVISNDLPDTWREMKKQKKLNTFNTFASTKIT